MLAFLLALAAPPAWSDAIIRSQAMSAAAIAQYHVEPSGVRLELEIGARALEGFADILPDELFERLTGRQEPLAERLARFLTEDLYVTADDGAPIPGRLRNLEPRDRVRRDPISGTPLPSPAGETPEAVVFAEVDFPFETRPSKLTFGKARAAEVGFVLYHQGVAVNDFRYLTAQQQLTLDWDDPWYSSFSRRALQRSYFAPMSGFIYVEPYEVRKEIILRPKDLQQWLELGLTDRSTIPVAMQAELKRQVGEFLRERQVVTIDGEAITPELARVNFLDRTLTSSQVIDPPRELDLNVATLGVIFVYPTVKPLPQTVTMTWDLFSDKMPMVPAASVDQAGPLPAYLEPDYPVLEWQNFLRFPELPSLKAVLPPPGLLQQAVAYGRWLILGLVAYLLWQAGRQRLEGSRTLPTVITILVLSGGFGASFLAVPGVSLSQDYARAVVGDLLHNVYRAFDFRSEEDVYDVLAQSVAGDLLTDIYLETRRALTLEKQGGARAKVKEIELLDLAAEPAGGGGMVARVTWLVSGSVGHWGHLHERRNRYEAELDLEPVDGAWKLVGMDVFHEQRL